MTPHLPELLASPAGEGDSVSQHLLMQAHALHLLFRGHLAPAEQLFARGLGFVRTRPEQEHLLPYTLTHLGQLHALRGEYREAVAVLEEAVRTGDRNGIHIAEGAGTLSSVLAMLGDFERAEVVGRNMAEEGRRCGDKAVVALASAHLASVFHARGDWSAAITAAEEAMKLAVEGHLLLPEYLAAAHLGLPLARTNRLTSGIRAAEHAISLAERSGLHLLLDQVYAYLAELLIEFGDLPTAARTAGRAEAMAREDGYLYGFALSVKVQGVLAAHSG